MKITIEPTGQFKTVNGAVSRMWRGVTDEGAKCELAVAMIIVAGNADNSAFARELREVKPETELVSFDYRFVV